MRLNVQPVARASDLASIVLPTPGTSSISRCPPAARPMMASSASECFPIRTCSIALTRSRSVWVPVTPGSGAVASFVFLARAARARVVAANLRCGHTRTHGRTSVCSRTPRPPRGAIGIIGAIAPVGPTAPVRVFEGTLGWRWRWWCLLPHLQVIDGVDDICTHTALQLVEHARGFDLVFDQRVALAVRAQTDAFAQVVNRGEVLNPQPVHDIQHPDALEQPHLLVP